jgi:hypothetical protein
MGGPSTGGGNGGGGNTGADEGFFKTERDKKKKQREEAERMERENRGGGNNQKSAEQPKVKSQMDNTDVKSDLITNEPLTADEIILKNKRKGRRSTVLTSVTGVDAYPTLSKKSLLGG